MILAIALIVNGLIMLSLVRWALRLGDKVWKLEEEKAELESDNTMLSKLLDDEIVRKHAQRKYKQLDTWAWRRSAN